MKTVFRIRGTALPEVGIVDVIINAIPDDWKLRTGVLTAFLITNRVSPNTKLHFGSSLTQMIEKIDINGVNPDITGILFHRRLPARVVIGDPHCFGECEVLSPAEGKEVARRFTREDYRGDLLFSPSPVDDQFHRSCFCRIVLPVGGYAHITVAADDGKDYLEWVTPILKACRNLPDLAEEQLEPA